MQKGIIKKVCKLVSQIWRKVKYICKSIFVAYVESFIASRKQARLLSGLTVEELFVFKVRPK